MRKYWIIVKWNPQLWHHLLAYTLKELRRDGLDVDNLADDHLLGTFQLLSEGKISKDAVSDVLVGVLKEKFSPEEVAEKLNLLMLSEEDVAI